MNEAKASTNANQALESAFAQEMHGIYQRALSEAGYKARRFLHMLHDHGGLETARMLIHAPRCLKAIRHCGSAAGLISRSRP